MLIRRPLFVTVTAVALGIALPSLAQQVREPVLKGNPYRTIGGSCVYGGQGELLFASKGARCASRQEVVPEDEERAPSRRSSDLSSTLRAELSTLIEGHSHLAEELARLRRAVAEGRKDDALQASAHVVEELTEHLAHEERLFEQLSAEQIP